MEQGGNRDHSDRGKGNYQAHGDKVEERQRMNQDWVQVINRKVKNKQGGEKPIKEPAQRMTDKLEANNPFSLLEEGETDNIQQPEEEVETQEGVLETELNSGSDHIRQSKIGLVKANSVNHLDDLLGKEYMDKIPMFRSSSMTDIPTHYKESRLDYLREEFQHYHLIAKHLQKTKEETLKRLQLMEARQSQSRGHLEDIQHILEEGSQMELVSQIPETQEEQ